MQIKINLQIFIFVIIFIFTHQIAIYGWLMLFAFIHEMGHMVIGLVFKLKPKSLSITPYGLSVIFETYGEAKIIEIKKVFIALARTNSKYNYLYNNFIFRNK